METIFDSLLFIKRVREESALKRVRQTRQMLLKAEEAVIQKQEVLQNHIDWREAEEIRLYSLIDNQPIKLKEIEEFQTQIALMRGRDSALVADIVDAKEAVTKTQKELIEAESGYQKAAAATNKFIELSEQNKDILLKATEYKEDLELEEFIVKDIETLG